VDKTYWDQFYAKAHPDLQTPSSFARTCLGWLGEGQALFELGCGNGRDALFFARSGLRVTAVDQSEVAIGRLRALGIAAAHAPTFLCASFAELGEGHAPDAVYSRFTLHAVPAGVASTALGWAYRSLRPGGVLLAEARSVKGSTYGLGEPRERDAFVYQGHYRRFVRGEELVAELEGLGFAIVDHVEADGLAVYKDDDPVVVRVVAKKAG